MNEKENQIPEFGPRKAPEIDEMPEEMRVAGEVRRLASEAERKLERPRINVSQERANPIPVESIAPTTPVAPSVPPIAPGGDPTISINQVGTAQEIIARLKQSQKYEEVMLPSRSFLYGGFGLERDKPIHVRPMTIEEEKVLSTPRLIRSGEAIDKIYESCVHENIPAGKLLSPDRVFLLFYIRGISYGPEYEAEIKCPSCDATYTESVNLNTLEINYCDDNFTGEIDCTLPDSGLNIRYRLPRGEDERSLTRHREMKIKNFAGGVDDTLIRRNIMLITRIANIENRMEIESIVNALKVRDSNFLRDQINNPGFGPQTDIFMSCPYCYNEWALDLPIDANFFFPRTKKVS